MALTIALVGLNHRTASIEVRERVAFTAEQARAAAESLREKGLLAEVVVLSTCNRSEIYGVPSERAPEAMRQLESFVAEFHSLQPAALDGCFYRHADLHAARHLFRVASGLDSMLLGETEILGQVREAYRQAQESRATGPLLNRLFQSALEVGKRVRAQTELGARPMSVAFAGVKLAEQVFGKFEGRTALILGAGAVGEQAVEHLRHRSISRVLVANRSRQRAEDVARRLGGEVVDWGALETHLATPDIVVTSVGEVGQVLRRQALERAMQGRANRPLFVMDLGVPRNVDAAAAELYNIYLYNIDDLTSIVAENLRAREKEIPRAEEIVDQHVARFEDWQAGFEVAALLNELREKLQTQRAEFLAAHSRQMRHLSAEERARLESLTEELLDLALREPEKRFREAAELRRRVGSVEELRHVFGLSKEPS